MIEQRERGRARTTSTGSCSATATSSPSNPKTLDELLEQMAAPDGGDVPAAGVDVARAARRAPGALRAGPAGHGPGVRGRPAGLEPVVGRSRTCRGASRRWRRRRRADAAVGDGRRDGAPARLRGPRPVDARRLPGRARSTTSTRTRCGGRSARTPCATSGGSRRSSARWSGPAWSRANGGRLEVTPRGARKLGERALVRVFEQLRRDREGAHEAREAGGLAEPTGATRPWRFGDAGQIAVQRSVFNAVVRGGPGAPRAARSPTTSSWSRPSSAPRPRPRCCWTCRSRCRCAGTASTRSGWRSRCTR